MSDLMLQQVVNEATRKVAESSGTQQVTPGPASPENVARFEAAMDGGQAGQGAAGAGQVEGAQGPGQVDPGQAPDRVDGAQGPGHVDGTQGPHGAHGADAVHGPSVAQQAQDFADGHKARIEHIKDAMGKNLSPTELISLHFDVMQVTFGQQLTKTVADETGKGVKTLFNRSS